MSEVAASEMATTLADEITTNSDDEACSQWSEMAWSTTSAWSTTLAATATTLPLVPTMIGNSEAVAAATTLMIGNSEVATMIVDSGCHYLTLTLGSHYDR